MTQQNSEEEKVLDTQDLNNMQTTNTTYNLLELNVLITEKLHFWNRCLFIGSPLSYK